MSPKPSAAAQTLSSLRIVWLKQQLTLQQERSPTSSKRGDFSPFVSAEAVRCDDEENVHRYMALLSRRRNSHQLKIDQVSRDLMKKKKGGRKAAAAAAHQHRPDTEEEQKAKAPLVFKLIEMRKDLTMIDQQIKRLATFKKVSKSWSGSRRQEPFVFEKSEQK